ncbi:hypothetical protein AF332_11525 [Sporosarcina globispora]|uniref:DUF2187 domain-containing protein n=1 Tax=Sporosarcina globispora TaxID=1459 RepID=A0A0M0GC97_SPOGL|nr:hypothetical protein AF332_11525 [Sporosarcina globispora]
MKINQRVLVTEEESPFHNREGVITQIQKYYITVQLNNFPCEMKFTDDELTVLEDSTCTL